MSQLMVPVIYGSVRTARQGIRAAHFVVAQLEKRGIKAVLVDPLQYPLPLLDRMYKEFPKGEAPPVMESLAQLFRAADGFAIVCGEYNHGIPPALKNMLDHYLEEYFFRPAAITTYSGGRWGGAHAAMQLRMSLAEMGMITTPTLFQIPSVQNTFDTNGVPSDPNAEKYSAEFFEEFIWFIEALGARRKTGVPY
jgi:NAD(P)H-dependent FMN reductase